MFSLLHGKKRSATSQAPDHKAPNHTVSAQSHQSIPNSALASGDSASDIPSGTGKPSLAQTMQQRVQALTERTSHAGQPNRTGIPDRMKKDIENRSGLSFDDVQVHYNSDKPAQFDALAYTQGNQIYVGPGQEQHLPHELGHVVQQKQGLVTPTSFENGQPVNTSNTLENAATTFNHTMLSQASHTLSSASTPVIQMKRTQKQSGQERRRQERRMEREDQRAGGHAHGRHGGRVTNAQLEIRAQTGLTPDGARGSAVDSSAFISLDMERGCRSIATQRYARAIQRNPEIRNGRYVDNFNFGEVVGRIIPRNGTREAARETSHVCAVFRDGQLITLYPTD